MNDKQEAYEQIREAIHSCTEEGTDRTAVVVLIDHDLGNVKVYGMNVGVEDVPQLLVDVAEEVYDRSTIAAIHDKYVRKMNA